MRLRRLGDARVDGADRDREIDRGDDLVEAAVRRSEVTTTKPRLLVR
jgi:hypothetical protein